MKRLSIWVYLVVMAALVGACSGGVKPVDVSPVTGLPQGTDGMPWWNDSVFYEIFVRSFKDSNGDGIGDFNGITEKLDYLNDGDPATSTDLGVTGLWLMPVNPSPSYHGYDVTDYYTVNPQYGTMEDFQNLLAEAHKRGIRVIIDMVMNHTSTAHPWFVDSKDPASPYRDWYIWSQDNPGYSGPWGENVWYKANNAYYYAIFWEGMPDLNYRNPAVVAEMEKVAKFWLSFVGVDGFRLDAAKHIVEEGTVQENSSANHAWWKTFHGAYKAENPQAMTIGEVWNANDVAAKYVQGDELDLVFNFDLSNAMLSAATFYSPGDYVKTLQSSLDAYPPGQFASFLTNHDMDRVMNKVGGDELKARMAGSLLLTAPGVSYIYYGEEIGMSGAKPDENIRLPMQWSDADNAGFTTGASAWRPPYIDYKQKNVALQLADPGSLLSHYRALIQLRNHHAALRVGDFTAIQSNDRHILAFLRVSQGETLLVLVNVNKEAAAGYKLNLEKGPLSGKYQAALLLASGFEKDPGVSAPSVNATGGFGDYDPLSGGTIPPGGTVVIQLQGEH